MSIIAASDRQRKQRLNAFGVSCCCAFVRRLRNDDFHI